MKFNDMSKEQLAAILQGLTEQGKVLEVDIVQMTTPAPSEEMKGLCDLVHGLLCPKTHGDGNIECDYYIEESLFEGWSLPTHRRWLQEVGSLMKEFDLKSVQDLAGALRAVANLVRELTELRAVSVNRYHLVATILVGFLKNELSKLNPPDTGASPTDLLV